MSTTRTVVRIYFEDMCFGGECPESDGRFFPDIDVSTSTVRRSAEMNDRSKITTLTYWFLEVRELFLVVVLCIDHSIWFSCPLDLISLDTSFICSRKNFFSR